MQAAWGLLRPYHRPQLMLPTQRCRAVAGRSSGLRNAQSPWTDPHRSRLPAPRHALPPCKTWVWRPSPGSAGSAKSAIFTVVQLLIGMSVPVQATVSSKPPSLAGLHQASGQQHVAGEAHKHKRSKHSHSSPELRAMPRGNLAPHRATSTITALPCQNESVPLKRTLVEEPARSDAVPDL